MKKLLLLLASSLALAQAPVIPLEGLDPVALVKGQQLDGDKKFSVVRGHFQYQFASAENKAIFEKEPERYEIQLGGSCARMGAQVGGSPDTYAVVEGKIYVFGSPQCHKRFIAAPDKYLESKQPAPAKLPASPAAASKGRELLAGAVEAMGGAGALDSLTAYQESRERNKETRTIVFPDRFHVERTFNEKFHVSQTISGGTGFVMTANGSRDLPATAVADMQRENRRELLAILRARSAAGFQAVALDDHTVAVEFEGERMSLSLDPATGRIVSLKYHGRGPGGVFGDIAYSFSDFHRVGKLTLPFSISAAFDGVADPSTVTVQSIVLNPEIAANLFQRP
jgi:YHS domain-containing protein